ncbi:MAG TPA: hypothetical protein VLM11_20425 [Streptosporangiaceae bacterium]|nr:hypothetical protein [Streptosporangiaceae bacterium]
MGMYRMAFAAGFATGYVVGTRAGRERYEQLVKLARQTAEHPAVQQAAGVVQAQAQKVGGQLQEKVPQVAQSAAQSVGSHIPGIRSKNGHGSAGTNGGKGAGNGSPFVAATDNGPGSKRRG